MKPWIPSALVGMVLLSVPVCAEECAICDPEIVMTPALASCFLGQAGAVLDEMSRQKLEYQLVNLGTCAGVSSETRGALPFSEIMRSYPKGEEIFNAPSKPLVPTTTFILDKTGILCLANLIRSDPNVFDPAAAFRRAEMCR